MAAGKEIKTKIASVKNTQKITAAMEMVAASKMRRAQDQMFATRPYAQRIANRGQPRGEFAPRVQAPLSDRKTGLKRVGIVAVSTDRGLCGGLNTNLFKKALNLIGDLDGRGHRNRGGYLRHQGARILQENRCQSRCRNQSYR